MHDQIGSVLDTAANQLLDMAGDDEIFADDIAPALHPLLAKLAKQYTMAQEREVHRALTEDPGRSEASDADRRRAGRGRGRRAVLAISGFGHAPNRRSHPRLGRG
jgi:hypothetical protein